jgi:Acetyl-CoA hydrolase/transferase C-terminal domain
VPLLLAGPLTPDIVLVQTSAPSGGTVSLSTEVNVLPAAIEAACGGLVIAQVNPRVPYAYGASVLALDDIDYAIEADLPLPSPVPRPAGETSALIGDRVAALVPDGAIHSPGGQAIIALPSWHPKADVSTVVPRLAGPVTSFQHSYFVSEQGTAALWGHDASEQARQIIGQVAHPSARDQLRAAGRELGFQLEPTSAIATPDRRMVQAGQPSRDKSRCRAVGVRLHSHHRAMPAGRAADLLPARVRVRAPEGRQRDHPGHDPVRLAVRRAASPHRPAGRGLR